VVEWSRALDVRLSEWCCSVSMVWLQIPSNYKKGCTRLAVASDKVYLLLSYGRWFSLGTPVSSTTKTDRHDIDEILLKVALKHQKFFLVGSVLFIFLVYCVVP
jgi:hypothetical protein